MKHKQKTHSHIKHSHWVAMFFVTLLLGAGLLFFSVMYEQNYKDLRPGAQACVDIYRYAGTEAVKDCIGTTYDLFSVNRVRSHIFAILGVAASSASLILLMVAYQRHRS